MSVSLTKVWKLNNQRLHSKVVRRSNDRCVEQLTDILQDEGSFEADLWLPDSASFEVDDSITLLPFEIDFDLSHKGWECRVTATLDEFSYSSGYATWEIGYGIFNKEV